MGDQIVASLEHLPGGLGIISLTGIDERKRVEIEKTKECTEEQRAEDYCRREISFFHLRGLVLTDTGFATSSMLLTDA